jgi:aryl-alcohol dehydrogenase-like predicted oxidoreductase
MRRRRFLRWSLFGLGGLCHPKAIRTALPGGLVKIKRAPLPKRKLGNTGEELSIIGLGGMVFVNEKQEEINRIVQDAVDHGINYFDVAPTYGNAEELLGPALKPFRKNVFLACKTQKRDRNGAEEELNQSLQRLQTDFIDLYQLHALTDVREVERALGWRGAMDTVLKAKEEGKIRYIGFSAHSSEAALRAMEKFEFDTVLFPINYVCFYKAGFGPDVIRKAREKKMGILAIKGLAKQPWPDDELKKFWPKAWYQPITNPEEAYLALRFTLSQPVTAAIPPGDVRLFRRALEIAHSFTPINDLEERRLKLLAQSLEPLFPLK